MLRAQKDVLHETTGYEVECDEDSIEMRFTCSRAARPQRRFDCRPSKMLLSAASIRPETAFALNTTATFAFP